LLRGGDEDKNLDLRNIETEKYPESKIVVASFSPTNQDQKLSPK
jgi:hypothetical protein